MWLLPSLRRVAWFVVNTFYRFDLVGHPAPSKGPLLIVSNHPNAIADPACVMTAADRQVRFLAKAPLFRMPIVGPLFGAAGAIPVYRKQDEEGSTRPNDEMFRAVQEALTQGWAVGIFPEGISHSAPSLAPLRTGAARIALGTAAILGRPFPIVPIGLTFRSKERFRSPAHAIVGEPVQWNDLAPRGENDAEAARELTARIDDGLRNVTLNLEQWDDAPAVLAAESIFASEFNLPSGAEPRHDRLVATTRALARLRQSDPARAEELRETVLHFSSSLRAIGVRVSDLDSARHLSLAVFLRIAILSLMAPLVFVGRLLFGVPYLLTEVLSRQKGIPLDLEATVKIFGGGLLYLLWILSFVVVGWRWGGWKLGTTIAIVLPLLAVGTIGLAEWWYRERSDLRRALRLGPRESLRRRLLERRRELAETLLAVWKDDDS